MTTTNGAGCARCTGTPGWEAIVAAGNRRLQRCACWTMAHAAAPASVPREFRDATWATWRAAARTGHSLEAARAFLAAGDDGRDLYLCGTVGTGKTRLACTMLNEAWRAGARDVRFARVPRLLYDLQPSAAPVETDRFGCLEAASLLVLDDLGAERDAATDYTARTLLMLYEARCDAGRRTVWTSNKTPLEISEFMGDDRLASRIVGRCRVVALDGQDWRLRHATRPRRVSDPPVHDGKAAAAGA